MAEKIKLLSEESSGDIKTLSKFLNYFVAFMKI